MRSDILYRFPQSSVFVIVLPLTLCLFMCNIPQGRAGGVAVLMDLLDGSRQFLVAAEDR